MMDRQFRSKDSAARHPDMGMPNPGPRKPYPGNGGVSKKIGHLVREGRPQKQAVAMALSMKRAGQLTKAGGYRRAGK